jgi:hypothetical protein
MDAGNDNGDVGIRPAPLLLGAIAWSWVWWAVAIAAGGVETTLGGISMLLGAFGPALAVVTAIWRSPPAYRASFRRRLLQWRIGGRWLLAAAVLTAGPKLIAISLAALGGHRASGESITLAAIPMSLAFGTVVVWIEEPLWRGAALDGFKNSVAKASLLIGVAWSIWHMPLFAVEGTFQHDLGLFTADFWIFSVGVVGLSVFLTWLVIRSGGSILLAMVAHLMINATGEFLPDDTTVRALEMVVIVVVAALLFTRLQLPNMATASRARPALSHVPRG